MIEVEQHRSRYPFCQVGEAFDVPCFHLQRTFDVPMTRELTAVFQGSVKVGTAPIFRIVREYSRTKIRAESSSNGSKVAEWRFHSAQKSELSSHQMARKLRIGGFTPHKIRAELSSNGSQLKLRTAGLTPHFHAELL